VLTADCAKVDESRRQLPIVDLEFNLADKANIAFTSEKSTLGFYYCTIAADFA